MTVTAETTTKQGAVALTPPCPQWCVSHTGTLETGGVTHESTTVGGIPLDADLDEKINRELVGTALVVLVVCRDTLGPKGARRTRPAIEVRDITRAGGTARTIGFMRPFDAEHAARVFDQAAGAQRDAAKTMTEA